jgi:hypothetical protein
MVYVRINFSFAWFLEIGFLMLNYRFFNGFSAAQRSRPPGKLGSHVAMPLFRKARNAGVTSCHATY